MDSLHGFMQGNALGYYYRKQFRYLQFNSPYNRYPTYFHKALRQFSKTPNIAPPIPEWVFTCLLGESAQMVTRGNAVAPKGLLDTGFVFEYTDLKNALSSLLNRV